MTPPLDYEAACSGCFLRERTGGVCPMVREDGLAAAEAARQAAVLRALVLVEAPNVPSLAALVRVEAERRRELPTPGQLVLPATSALSIPHDPRKEPIRVALSCPPQ